MFHGEITQQVMAKERPDYLGTACSEADLRRRFQSLGETLGREEALGLVLREMLGFNIPDAPWCWNIYLQNWVIFGVNVGKYSIHGAYGNDEFGYWLLFFFITDHYHRRTY
jgi:hypothetical protein